MEQGLLTIKYRIGQDEKTLVVKASKNNEDLAVVIENENHQLKVSLFPKTPVTLIAVKYTMPYHYSDDARVFINGYQSWTDSHEMTKDDAMKNISRLAKPIMHKYQFDKYGDYGFANYSRKKGQFHGFTYAYIRNSQSIYLIGSLSERQGYTIIRTDMKNHKLSMERDCENLVIVKEYDALNLFLKEGIEDKIFDEYFSLMGLEKPKAKPMTGWTSWYNYYEDISEDIICENLKAHIKSEASVDIFQIDDGYQTHVGDWLSIDAKKFPNGMKGLADDIKAAGYKAGLWLAPFVCEKDSKVFKEKPEWILRNQAGQMVICGSNWSSFYALDLENQEVRDYLRLVFDTVLNEWGYDMVKLDFLYAASMISDDQKTRGSRMCEAMDFLRDLVGDKLILACGVPLGPAFGKVDYCRIGCDVGLDWDDKFHIRKLHRERISTLNALGNAVGRRHLDGRAFVNDPDVFLLRDDHLDLSHDQKETLRLINGWFGSLLFTSDNLNNYDDRKKQAYHQVMNMKERRVKEVKWHDKLLFEAIDTQNHHLCVNLSGQTKSMVTKKGEPVTLAAYQSKMLGE